MSFDVAFVFLLSDILWKALEVSNNLLILVRESERFILRFRYCNILKINDV